MMYAYWYDVYTLLWCMHIDMVLLRYAEFVLNINKLNLRDFRKFNILNIWDEVWRRRKENSELYYFLKMQFVNTFHFTKKAISPYENILPVHTPCLALRLEVREMLHF